MTTKPGRVSGRNALVFGGGVAGDGLGNGKATALLLAQEGARVAVADIVRENAQVTCAEIEAGGGSAIALVPGMIDTPHASAAFHRRLPREEAERIIAARTRTSPTGTQGSPWDIAQAVLFLADEAVSYVNGVALLVDGGFTLTTPSW